MQCVVTLNERKSTSALLVWQNRHAVASILHANASAFGASHSIWALSGNPTPKWALNLRVRLSTLSRVHTQRCITGGSCHKYHFGRDKSFVDKSMLVVMKVLSRKNYVCRDKTFVTTYICRDKHNFGSILLSRQKTCFVATNAFATKMILVAAPANDRDAGKCLSNLVLETHACSCEPVYLIYRWGKYTHK